MGDRLIEEGCTCISEIEREKAERTGWLKLYEFPPGEDEDGNPCPIHDPRKKTMTEPTSIETMRLAQKERGEQLRALVVSWHDDKTFVEALAEQTKAIEAGTFAPNDDWGIMANEIYAAYTSQPRMTAWDNETEKPPEGPKLVLPS